MSIHIHVVDASNYITVPVIIFEKINLTSMVSGDLYKVSWGYLS